MARIFKTPFGAQGDTEQVPEAPQGDGSVSLTQGFGYDYEREYEDPAAKDIRREVMNGLFHDVTEAIGDIQLSGIAKWDSAAAPYPAGAVVWHSSVAWMSTAGNNSSVPGAGSWKAVDLSSSIRLSESIDQVPDAETVQEALVGLALNSQWLGTPVGSVIALQTHLSGVSGPPTNNSAYRFVKLTASDSYNSGILDNESVSGSSPLVMATARVNYPSSPLDGQTIRLLNTEGRYLKPGETPGEVGNDRLQNITGEISAVSDGQSAGFFMNATGAFTTGGQSVPSVVASPGGGDRMSTLSFNFSNYPGARVGVSTDVKRMHAEYYMRIA